MIKYEGTPAMFRVGKDDITYEELAARIRQGMATVVESKGPDGKTTSRPVSVSNLGRIIFHDNGEEVIGHLQVEEVAEKDEKKEASAKDDKDDKKKTK